MIEKIKKSKEKLDTIVYPPNKPHYSVKIPWKIVWVMFFNWVLIRRHIFWETDFWEFQMKETKKEINWKENKQQRKR